MVKPRDTWPIQRTITVIRIPPSKFNWMKLAPNGDGSSSNREQKLLSHSQWTLYKRKVCVPDSQAKSVVVTKTGHRLSLFGFEQTKEKI